MILERFIDEMIERSDIHLSFDIYHRGEEIQSFLLGLWDEWVIINDFKSYDDIKYKINYELKNAGHNLERLWSEENEVRCN